MAQLDKEQNMALLKVQLQVPLIVRDLLVLDRTPDADAQYGLSEMMSNMSPDMVLLCSAVTMKEIASCEGIISADLTFLQMECDRIIERYHAHGDTNNCATDMKQIAEDMDAFLDLMELCHMSYEIMNPKVTGLLDLLTAQISAQVMILDEVIRLQERSTKTTKTFLVKPYTTGFAADNVVMFPQQS